MLYRYKCLVLPTGAILTGIILKGLPHQNASSFFAVYVTVFMLNGALNAWPAPACNNPIFAGRRSASPTNLANRTFSVVRHPCSVRIESVTGTLDNHFRCNCLEWHCVPAEIVPARLRTFIYAFDRSFEMAVAACAAPVVGKLAESAFGFEVLF